MDNRDSFRRSLERSNPRKRSFADLNVRRSRPARYLPLHLDSNSSFAPAPSESLNRNFPPPQRPHRYEGDGFDFRRPVMTRPNPQAHRMESPDNVIDLTSDSESPQADTPNVMDLEFQDTPPRERRAFIPARTPEVIDLLEEDDNDEDFVPTTRPQRVSNLSPEVEFVAERPRHDRPQQTSRPGSPRSRREPQQTSWLRASLSRYAGLGTRTHFEPMQHYTQALLGRNHNHEHQNRGDIYGLLDDVATAMQPIIPTTDWFRGPGALDFDMVGFELQTQQPVEPARPAVPSYQAPSAPPDGFTRTPKEDDMIVCPKCDIELGTGKDTQQKQIWVIRACGHAYCGNCIHGKTTGKKRILTKCVCEGCSSSIRNSKTCCFVIYI